MNERDKDIVDIRKERDDLLKLVARFIHATRHDEATLRVRDIRELAKNYIKRKGLEGSILR